MTIGISIGIGTAASVRVPATSANLGPGFDCLALALAWYDDVSVQVTGGGLAFEVSGEGADAIPLDESHLVLRSLRAALDGMGVSLPGLLLRSVNRIPHGRGLGSSAAAICAGVMLARALVSADDSRNALDDDDALALASEIEGHPDNVAACLLGGATLAWTDADTRRARAVRLPLAAGLLAAVFIPDFQSSTTVARALLPTAVSHADAAANAARSALLVAALTGRQDLLLTATEDRLHQPYRAPSMPESASLLGRLRAAGVAATISGAGPTVLGLATAQAELDLALSLAPGGWNCMQLAVADKGAVAR